MLVWILGGVLCAAGLLLMLVLEAMALGGAQVGNNVLDFVFLSMVTIPLVWLVALILCRREAKRRQRSKLLRLYHLLPFGAWALHLLILVFLHYAVVGGSFRRANDRATAKASEAIKLTPSQPENYFARGNLRTDVGKYDDAIADFTAILRVEPGDPIAQSNLQYLQKRKGH